MLFKNESPSLGSPIASDTNGNPCLTLKLSDAGSVSKLIDGQISDGTSKFSVSAAGNIVAAGTLAVTGATTQTGALSVTGTLAAVNAATVGTTLGVTGAVTASSTLHVVGAATLDSTLSVAGAITATGGIVGGTAGVPALGAPITADGAIAPGTSAVYVITKSASAAVMTLAAPTATTDDGKVIVVNSFGSTARAHVITITGLFDGASATDNTATFAAVNGAGISLLAYQARWLVMSANGIIFSTV